MNKKGFTLVEILSVIVLISLLMGIGVAGVSRISSNMKEKSLSTKISNIEQAAVLYGQDNRTVLQSDDCRIDDKDIKCKKISVYGLINEDYLDSENYNKVEFNNPKDNRSMLNNCIYVYKKNNRVESKYIKGEECEPKDLSTVTTTTTVITTLVSPEDDENEDIDFIYYGDTEFNKEVEVSYFGDYIETNAKSIEYRLIDENENYFEIGDTVEGGTYSLEINLDNNYDIETHTIEIVVIPYPFGEYTGDELIYVDNSFSPSFFEEYINANGEYEYWVEDDIGVKYTGYDILSDEYSYSLVIRVCTYICHDYRYYFGFEEIE